MGSLRAGLVCSAHGSPGPLREERRCPRRVHGPRQRAGSGLVPRQPLAPGALAADTGIRQARRRARAIRAGALLRQARHRHVRPAGGHPDPRGAHRRHPRGHGCRTERARPHLRRLGGRLHGVPLRGDVSRANALADPLRHAPALDPRARLSVGAHRRGGRGEPPGDDRGRLQDGLHQRLHAEVARARAARRCGIHRALRAPAADVGDAGRARRALADEQPHRRPSHPAQHPGAHPGDRQGRRPAHAARLRQRSRVAHTRRPGRRGPGGGSPRGRERSRDHEDPEGMGDRGHRDDPEQAFPRDHPVRRSGALD